MCSIRTHLFCKIYIVCYNESDSEFRYDDQILIFDKNFSLVRHFSADEILEAGMWREASGDNNG